MEERNLRKTMTGVVTSDKMDKTVGVFENNLAEVRAGRANPAILNKIKIDYYGVPTPISQVAGISVPEARLIVIQPWDLGILKEIEKEILKSDIGINPNNDGKVIRLSFPELNEERRKEIVKSIKKMAEESKIAVRSIRRDGIEEFKKKQKDSEITEDELRMAEEEIQKITDKNIDEIDKLTDGKEKECRKKQQGRPSSQEYDRQTEIPCYREIGDTGLLHAEKQGKKRRHIGKRIPEGMFP